jgi:(p)ppGpp synthase/HD superfamily hydrolase
MLPWFLTGRPLTAAAFAWASERHGRQLRGVDRAPFILHPLEVAALLAGRDHPDHVVAAGLLHDIVEDTDARIEEVAERFGARVAEIVAAVTEDPAIADWKRRKGALREQVAAAGPEPQAVYTADKVVKARELRATAGQPGRSLAEAPLARRLAHYDASLRMLRGLAPDAPLVRQLQFELWALRRLPPAPARATRARTPATADW